MAGSNSPLIGRSTRHRGYFYKNYIGGFSPRYWKSRHRRQLIAGKFNSIRFQLKALIHRERESASYLWQIILTILSQIAFAIIVVSIALVIDRYIVFLNIDQQTVQAILVVILQASAIFIGLYFAAISVIASTVYARVPGDVRSILMNEKFGNVYVKIVALLGVTSLLLLIANAYKYPMGIAVVVVIGFLGIISIFAFVKIGNRVFHFFDPSVLAMYITKDLISSIEAATYKGYCWRDVAFQSHYQQKAELRLTTLHNILNVLAREPHPYGSSIRSLGNNILGVLSYYSTEKLNIPTESTWFKRTQQGRDWLTTEYTKIDLALSTGTALMPEIVPDQLWFEKLCEQMIVQVVSTLLDQKDLINAITVENGIQQTLNTFGMNSAIDEGVHFCHATWPLVRKLMHEQHSLEVENKEEFELGVYFTDFFCLGVLNLILGFAHFMRNTSVDDFGNSISKINWIEKADIYKTKMPRAVIEQFEYLEKGFETEIAIEGKICTPDWYRKQIALLGLARMVSKAVEDLIELVEQLFRLEVDNLIADNKVIFAAAFIERGIETCEKAQLLINEAEGCIDRLICFRRVEDIPWPALSWDNQRNKIKDIRKHLIARYAEILFPLSKLDIPDGLPDYFGHGYTVLADACFEALITGSEDEFSHLFPLFLPAGLIAYDRAGIKLPAEDSLSVFSIKKQTLLDLMAISGYSLIFSELDNKNYWEIVVDSWNAYLDSFPNTVQVVQVLMGIVKYGLYSLFIAPRDLVRTGWQQALERRMRSSGYMGDDTLAEMYVTRQRTRVHKSPIINAIYAGSYFVHDPEEVFIVSFLMKRPEAEGIELTVGAKSLLESIQRESDRHNDEDDDA